MLTVEMVRGDTLERIGQETTLTIGGNQQRQRTRVTTSETIVAIDSTIGVVGLCYIYHDSDSNAQYLDIGYSSGVYNHRLLPGECGLIPLGIATSSLFMVADANTYIEYEITERSTS